MFKRTEFMKCFNVVVLVLVLAGCKKEKLDPSLHFKANVSIEEKIQASKYNWNETKNITIHVTSPQDGMITIRALDGEIIYRGYLANEVLYEFVLKIPKEINQVLIEHGEFHKVMPFYNNKIDYVFK